MVTPKVVKDQLHKIGFKQYGWGSSEVKELPNILLPDEEIFEAANGFYDGGFALLLATDVRVLLIDKKPFNYLTVEDLRFDMINEIDYSHRFIGAKISISTGSKNLVFQSFNQPRLRKLIGHVQDCMATYKKTQQDRQQNQNQHLEEINQRLQAYLIAQHQHQEELEHHLKKAIGDSTPNIGPAPEPSRELADYLYAQSLLAEHRIKNPDLNVPIPPLKIKTDAAEASQPQPQPQPIQTQDAATQISPDELHREGLREILGKRMHAPTMLNPLPTISSAIHKAIHIRLRRSPQQETSSSAPSQQAAEYN